MSNDRPETLEETQRRLAGYSNPRPPAAPSSAMQPPPPPAGLQPPPPPVGIGPSAGSVPIPPPAGSSPQGYAAPPANPYGPAATTSSSGNGRRFGILLAVVGAVLAVAIGLFVFVGQLISSNTQAGPTPAVAPAPTVAPSTSDGDWANYPGSAYRDDAVVLGQLSAEEVRDTGEAILKEYRDELTSELGLVWVEEYPGSFERDINGYGEESMLYYYDSSSWLGEASASTPEARQQIMDVFERITAKYSATNFYRANDVYQAPESISSFGAERVEEQALWRFSSRGDETFPLRVGSSVWDRTLPTDPSFTDASGFYLEDGADGKLYVLVSASAFALLGEGDRDAYIEALKPYEGVVKPDSN